MKNLLTLSIFLFSLCGFSQEYIDVAWEKTFGGNMDDKATSIISTPDGGYLMTGWTKSDGNGGKDMLILKLDVQGKIEWRKIFGENADDWGVGVLNATKSGYIVAGNTGVSSTKYTYLNIRKIDAEKQKVKWVRTYGGSEMDKLTSIVNAADGGYFISGARKAKGDNDQAFWVVKIDKAGIKLWDNVSGIRYYDDEANAIVATKDGGCIAVGWSKETVGAKERMRIAKIGMRGNLQWEKTLGDKDRDMANAIAETKDGRFVIAGTTRSKGAGQEDMWLVKIDGRGEVLWEKTFGGFEAENVASVIGTSDGNCVIAGWTKSQGNGKENMYLMKIDTRGDLVWERSFGDREWDGIESIIETSDKGYMVAGWTKSENGDDTDMWIVKLVDNSEVMLSKYIAEKLILWEKKAKNETEEDFVKRINEANKEKVKKDFRKDAVNFYCSVENSLNNQQVADAKNEPVVTYRGGSDPLRGLNVSKAKKEMEIGNYYTLIIGIDKYKGDWAKLDNAVNDAKAIEGVLRSKYRFNYFRTLYDDQATRSNIITEMEWLVENVKEKDNVLIYYSGHGEYKEKLNKGYWVPIDATTMSTSKYISNSDIQTFLGGIQSQHTLLISDACFSGDIFRGKTMSVPFENSERYYNEVHNLMSRKAMSSGGIEPVMDGGKDGHSVFAYYLLKSLNTNQNRYFDASQLYDKIKIPVYNNSEQSPLFKAVGKTGDEGGQFVFIKK